MNRLGGVALIVVAFVLTAVAPAGAADPFTDYRQAAQAQYGGNEPGEAPAESGGVAPGGATGGDGGGGQGGGAGQGSGGGAGATGAAADATATLFFLSPVDPVVVKSVNAVLAQLGEPAAQATSLNEPLNVPGIATAASGTRYANVTPRRLALFRALGRRIGRELFEPSPFFSQIGPVLFNGLTTFEPQKFVVFARSGTKLDRQATRIRNAFENGLVRAVRAYRFVVNGEKRRVPIAGVETTYIERSQIKWYKARKVPSVDNVNTVNGQRALLAILRDGARGHYGVKETAQRLLPRPLELDPAAATIADAKGDSDTGLGTSLTIGLLALMGAWVTLVAVSRMRRSRQSPR